MNFGFVHLAVARTAVSNDRNWPGLPVRSRARKLTSVAAMNRMTAASSHRRLKSTRRRRSLVRTGRPKADLLAVDAAGEARVETVSDPLKEVVRRLRVKHPSKNGPPDMPQTHPLSTGVERL